MRAGARTCPGTAIRRRRLCGRLKRSAVAQYDWRVRPFDLVIFDCDGVLVDSERLIVRLEAQICQERGWPLTEDDVIREFVGLSDSAMRARLSELVGEELADDWDVEYTDRYRRAFAEDVEAVAGVAAAIDSIEQAGLSTCVASSGSHQKMALIEDSPFGLVAALDAGMSALGFAGQRASSLAKNWRRLLRLVSSTISR